MASPEAKKTGVIDLTFKISKDSMEFFISCHKDHMDIIKLSIPLKTYPTAIPKQDGSGELKQKESFVQYWSRVTDRQVEKGIFYDSDVYRPVATYRTELADRLLQNGWEMAAITCNYVKDDEVKVIDERWIKTVKL